MQEIGIEIEIEFGIEIEIEKKIFPYHFNFVGLSFGYIMNKNLYTTINFKWRGKIIMIYLLEMPKLTHKVPLLAAAVVHAKSGTIFETGVDLKCLAPFVSSLIWSKSNCFSTLRPFKSYLHQVRHCLKLFLQTLCQQSWTKPQSFV